MSFRTTGQFHLSPDIRPQERCFRIDTVSLRGLFNQQIHDSKRSLRSVEDFIEFEQRTAYFNGDPILRHEEGLPGTATKRDPAHLERFLKEPGDGPIKTFTLRGIKDSPPYLHDGRCLTLEDTVEFFNLVLQTNLSQGEKKDLVIFMRAL